MDQVRCLECAYKQNGHAGKGRKDSKYLMYHHSFDFQKKKKLFSEGSFEVRWITAGLLLSYLHNFLANYSLMLLHTN